MRILIVEPYYGTSHRSLIEGLINRLPFETELLTLSPRKWKWRMRGGAWILGETAKSIQPCDVIFVSDFLDLPAFLALGPKWLRDAFKIVYFHENQLSYPARNEDERDIHFALTNVETALTADRLIFNSLFHLEEFTGAIEGLVKKFPDYRPEGIAEKIYAKSCVIPVPLDLSEFLDWKPKRGPLSVLWNCRWEYDKAPERFFKALFNLSNSNLNFRLAVAGESFQDYPEIFDEAKDKLADKITSWGFLETRENYLELLAGCDVVVSTAIHEFFGIAIAEAVAAGCFPLVPNRLAYPERYPKMFLYNSDDDLEKRLGDMMKDPDWTRRIDARALVTDLDWQELLPAYIEILKP
ncbi:DUF3524 domain-containing protein [bacterium]|nr:MAG: DUF3524 domain-containing protein [bacterium]